MPMHSMHILRHLPNDRIAVALSTAENGNALQLFDKCKFR